MIVRAVLLGTLVVTSVVVADVVSRDRVQRRVIAAYLLLFTLLFLLRVAGQVLVWRRRPRFLPPMSEWNLVPYRVLLPVQLVVLAVMGGVVAALFLDATAIAVRRDRFGWFLIGIGVVYACSMLVRYTVRMYRRPEARWFGGAIPIVFHVVLAAFLVTWGRYHVSA